MARVEIRPSGRHQYAVVVEDYQDQHGRRRKRVVQSFGNVNNANNLAEAYKFAAAINAGQSFVEGDLQVDRQQIYSALKILVGAAIAAAAIAWLFDQE